MIKLLEDLLIEATTNANVPGNLVAGLRKAVDAARAAALPLWPRRDKDGKVYDLPKPSSLAGKTFAFTGVLPTLSRDEACSRIEEAGGVIVSVVSAKLDYLVAGSESGSKLLKALELGVLVIGEKQLQAMLPASYKQLAAGMRTQEAEPATVQVAIDPPFRVCVKAHETNVGNTVPVGHVVMFDAGDRLQQPDCWVPCDKDGWVSGRFSSPAGLATEWRGHPGLSDWRPTASAPRASAIDEMAEQMQRWAAPTRDDAQPVAWFDKDGKIQGRVSDEQLDAILREALADLDKRNGWAAQEEVTREDACDPESCGACQLASRRSLAQDTELPALAVQEGGSHYKDMKIQPVEYIHANGLGYFEGNVVKYVSRWRAKGGLQDLKKARHYLDLLIELEGGTK